jgi:alkanesulfonate monooxygenase
MSATRLRFGIWAPVSGPFLKDPAHKNGGASFAISRDLILDAERLGYETVLFAQHTIRPMNPDEDQLEAWTAAAALAALTRKIEIIAAIKPRLYNPVVLAKLALGIEDISRGRFALNFVNAWYKPELEKSGIGFPEHDERYVYGGEWLRIVKPLLEGYAVTHQGKYFSVNNYRLSPASRFRERPYIYMGGESEPARALTAELGDEWLINSRPIEEVKPLVADLAARPRDGKPLRFGLSAFVIARETDEEAQELHEEFLAIADKIDRTRHYQDVDPLAQSNVNQRKYRKVGTNGGTSSGLVGSYDTVASRIREFQEIGVGTFLLQFHPMASEMERFMREVAPRVHALQSEPVAA